MDFFAIDDSARKRPSRDGMRSLVSVGGLHVPGDRLRDLERELDALCRKTGFPKGEEFKWSPAPGQWMREHLVEDARERFFVEALEIGAGANAKAIVVVEDIYAQKVARGSASHEEDVSLMFLERAQAALGFEQHALVVFDRPGGGRKREDEFLAQRMETIRTGSAFTEMDRLALVVATDSKLSRTLQLADVVTSCSTAFVAGETKYSRRIFETGILPMLREEYGRKGGCGLKIHPDKRYGNLYHWLLGDSHFVRHQEGHPLPSNHFNQYRESPDRA
jgi:uncharacterized protein DUF3800